MDEKMRTVLDLYHERMRQEKMTTRDGTSIASSTATDEWLDGRLLAVGPDTGQLINLIARKLKAPRILELGTSYGYSAIWLADAARAAGGRVTTMELKDFKANYAQQMVWRAGLAEFIDFKVGDAVQMISELPFGLDFVLIDLWKDLYVPCLEALYPKLNPGAIIVADNMIHPSAEAMLPYAKAVRSKPDIFSILLPVGHGLEISRYKGLVDEIR